MSTCVCLCVSVSLWVLVFMSVCIRVCVCVFRLTLVLNDRRSIDEALIKKSAFFSGRTLYYSMKFFFNPKAKGKWCLQLPRWFRCVMVQLISRFRCHGVIVVVQSGCNENKPYRCIVTVKNYSAVVITHLDKFNQKEKK